MENSFIKWFIKQGWKEYSIPYLLFVSTSASIYFGMRDILASPVIVIVGVVVAYFGFAIGITAHMIITYKSSEK